MDEYEIFCIDKDESGRITQVGIRNEGIQPTSIILRLIVSGTYSFYTYRDGHKLMVHAGESNSDIKGSGSGTNKKLHIEDLDFLPKCKLPF